MGVGGGVKVRMECIVGVDKGKGWQEGLFSSLPLSVYDLSQEGFFFDVGVL